MSSHLGLMNIIDLGKNRNEFIIFVVSVIFWNIGPLLRTFFFFRENKWVFFPVQSDYPQYFSWSTISFWIIPRIRSSLLCKDTHSLSCWIDVLSNHHQRKNIFHIFNKFVLLVFSCIHFCCDFWSKKIQTHLSRIRMWLFSAFHQNN